MYSLRLTLIICLLSGVATAQKVMWMKPKSPIVCYGKAQPGHSHVPLPEQAAKFLNTGRVAETKSSNFVVTYIGFTPEAEAAFQKAVDIWETLLSSPIDIHVTAEWKPLGSNVLGSATTGTFFANFDGAQNTSTWYPVALAEKMANRELNDPNEADIFANFSSNTNWYYGLDGNTTPGSYDLVTVVLHELGHGLGFLDSYDINNGVASVGFGSAAFPVVYDLGLQSNTGQNLFTTAQPGTQALVAQLTSNNLFYSSPQVLAAQSNQPAKVFAPASFSPGSSIAHLDESTFFAASENSLMTPQIGSGESNFNPGPITLGMFSDMGWVFTYIDHTRLPSTEDVDGPFPIVATITSDAGPIASPKVYFNTGGTDVELLMTPTANPDEYEAVLPATGGAATYHYYISVNDNKNRTYVEPGKRALSSGLTQQYFTFDAGPDMQAPKINHIAAGFILETDTSLVVDAYISDNIGIHQAYVEYSIDQVAQPNVDLTLLQPEQDSIYRAVLDFGNGLPANSIIRYRIVAIDDAASPNQSESPTDSFHEVVVEAISETLDSYSNDFDSPSDDFFGNGYTIETPTGFTNGAIHSEHPYINGTGFPDDRRNLVYQLKSPIRIKDTDAQIIFDEIALVEPGAAGTVFGDPEFFDYVVVEGSIDGGTRWDHFGNGYDARAHAEWLAQYNSQIDGQGNSTATADASLFKKRTINMLTKFKAGDEVLIRFRLFIDPLANGWGWAIDNLKIQIDVVPPVVLHNHLDYVSPAEVFPSLQAKAFDNKSVDELSILYFKNTDEQDTLYGQTPINQLFALPVGTLVPGDVVNYKLMATDDAGNKTVLPTEGYFTVRCLQPTAASTTYSNSFNAATTDFVGNFFSIAQPTGFSNGALHSTHKYVNGFGLDSTSNYIALLTKPIVLATSNAYMRYDEIVIVEPQVTSIPFGTEAFNDYVVVEGSKDGGITWKPFANGYDATGNSTWTAAYINGTNGTPSSFRQRLVDLLANGNFSVGDEVLIRFRLFADASLNAWGWAIDNLFIQDPITGTEPATFYTEWAVYPNPTHEKLTISAEVRANSRYTILLRDASGRLVKSVEALPLGNILIHTLDMQELPMGLYLLQLSEGVNSSTRKVVKN
jgi:hypothetical protein